MIDLLKGQALLTKQIGKPYIFGHEVKLDDPNPDAFDCSELVEWFFHQIGLVVPDGSYNQYPFTVPVPTPQPFDLWFLLKGHVVHHVGLVLDDEKVIHAKGSKWGVVTQSIGSIMIVNGFSGFRRLPCLMTS